MGGAPKAPGKKLDKRRDGRKRVSAVERIGVLHPDAVTGVDRARAVAESAEGRASPSIREAEHGRSRTRTSLDRQQSAAVAGRSGAERAGCGLCLLRVALRERRVQQGHDGNVQSIEPHDGPIRIVAVIMPGARGSDDEVSFVHDGLLPVHGGVGALPFNDEAKGGLGVAVGRRHLSGKNELKARIQRRRHAGLATHSRVLEDQHPPLGLPGGDDVARLEEQ